MWMKEVRSDNVNNKSKGALRAACCFLLLTQLAPSIPGVAMLDDAKGW